MADPATVVLADLAEQLEIPEDGTLSKVLYADDQIRVVGFAFDAGQELTEHTATVPVVVQVVSGRFRFVARDDEWEIGPDSWVHMVANEPHSVHALEPSRLLLTLLRSS